MLQAGVACFHELEGAQGIHDVLEFVEVTAVVGRHVFSLCEEEGPPVERADLSEPAAMLEIVEACNFISHFIYNPNNND